MADIPIDFLSSKAPVYERKWIKKKLPEKKIKIEDLKKVKIEDSLIKILSSPNHSNKNWITQQYDQMVMCDTLQRSGSDAAIIKIHNKDKAIAVTVDSSANYCKSNQIKQIQSTSYQIIANLSKSKQITAHQSKSQQISADQQIHSTSEQIT